ncbi:hypothetical protein KIK06_15000 [Nocardiopsis sp. EMB25]|nr:hypothetical protein [Nocardiopsis sp. EMB25]
MTVQIRTASVTIHTTSSTTATTRSRMVKTTASASSASRRSRKLTAASRALMPSAPMAAATPLDKRTISVDTHNDRFEATNANTMRGRISPTE